VENKEWEWKGLWKGKGTERNGTESEKGRWDEKNWGFGEFASLTLGG